MKPGDRIVYRELYGKRKRRPGMIMADASRPTCSGWFVCLDDGARFVTNTWRLEPEPAVDQLARLHEERDS